MQNEAAFTLIELIVTVALAAIVAAVAIPAYQDFIRGQRATTSTNDLITAFHLARSEAVKRGGNVEVCSSADQANCGGNWADGWLVRDAGDGNVIRAWQGRPQKNLQMRAGAGPVEFNGDGEADQAYNFELWFDGCEGDETRQININVSGQITVNRNDDRC